MNSIAKRAINVLLRPFGAYLAQSTTRENARQIVNALIPIDPGFELIRVGGNNDGGYLLPNDMEGITHCFSPGVADTASFELDCLERGIRSFLADFSVDQPPINLEGCQFIKKFVGALNNDKFISLDQWVSDSLANAMETDLILQMDIEGAEYETILSTSKTTLTKFRILAIEFHHVESIRDTNFFQIVLSTLQRLKEHFEVVHVHPNNCCGITSIDGVKIPNVFEVTFLRKDRIKHIKPIKHLPHPLDQANVPSKSDILFPDFPA